MPVSFESPQPFAPGIAAGYGATEQFDKTLPTLAGLYESQARLRQQGFQAAADQATRAQIAGAQLAQQASLAGSEMDSREHMQGQDISARLEMQARDQQFHAAVSNRQMGQQDVMRMQQMQAGLAQLDQDVQAGYLTPAEAADSAFQLRTGVDRVRQRLEAEHAEQFKQQAEFKARAMALEVQNMENAKAFQVQAGLSGHTIQPFTDPNTGKQHWLAVDDKGKFYNPLVEHASKSDGDKGAPTNESPEFRTKNGETDYKAIEKAAEFHTIKELGERPKVSKDDPGSAQALKDWNAKKSAWMEGLERLQKYPGATHQERQAAEHNAQGSSTSQKEPASTPEQQAKTVADLIAKNPKLDGMAKSQAVSTLMAAQKLMAKETLSPAEREQLKNYVEYLKSVSQ